MTIFASGMLALLISVVIAFCIWLMEVVHPAVGFGLLFFLLLWASIWAVSS